MTLREQRMSGISIDLSDRVILVCGAGRGGIGGAVARVVAAAGATVVAVDRTQALVDETLADIAAAGGRGHGLVADLTDTAQSDPIVGEVVRRFDRLDGVANVAGGTQAGEWMRLEETPDEIFRRVLGLNLDYSFRICRDAAAFMIRRGTGGSLVNIGSISALGAAPYHGPYGAAKAGLIALTRSMAIEWLPHGIRANSVSPGAVATERVTSRPGWDRNNLGEGGDRRWARPDELANAVLFLLSDLASGVSGQNLTVDTALSVNFCVGDRAQMERQLGQG
jgi:NAD(P)-dependent dehydrogenase (short-subunit alcohol dehydrogenase family)